MAKLRPCEYRSWNSETRQWDWGNFGAFHQWGLAYEQFDNGVGNYTIALIETPDGNMVEAAPCYMRFTDKKEAENG